MGLRGTGVAEPSRLMPDTRAAVLAVTQSSWRARRGRERHRQAHCVEDPHASHDVGRRKRTWLERARSNWLLAKQRRNGYPQLGQDVSCAAHQRENKAKANKGKLPRRAAPSRAEPRAPVPSEPVIHANILGVRPASRMIGPIALHAIRRRRWGARETKNARSALWNSIIARRASLVFPCGVLPPWRLPRSASW